MGQEQSQIENQKPQKKTTNPSNLNSELLSQCLVKRKGKEDIRNITKNQLNQNSKPVLSSSPLKDKSNIENSFFSGPSKELDRAKDYCSQQQLLTKKPPILDVIKKMKKTVESSIDPVTITRFTDRQPSFPTQEHDQSKYESNLEGKLEQPNALTNNAPEIQNLNLQADNKISETSYSSNSGSETNLYEYYLRCQKQKQKQFGGRKQSENQKPISTEIIPAGQFSQTEPPTINNSVRQSFQALTPFIPQPQSCSIPPYQIQAQLAQLASENQELKQYSQQQILQMQCQQRLLLNYQSQQARFDQTENNQNRTPILINKNLLDHDTHKQMKPLFDESKTPRKEHAIQSDNKQPSASIPKNNERSKTSTLIQTSTGTFLTKSTEKEVKRSDLELFKPESQKSMQKKDERISQGDERYQSKIFYAKNRKAIKLDFNFDSNSKEKQGKCFSQISQCLNERKIDLTSRNNDEEEKQELEVKVTEISKEQQMKLGRRETMDSRRNIRRNETVKKLNNEQKACERFLSPQMKNSSELMQRLANGQKATQVNNKDMVAITRKNYDNLPEIKKKKEEEQKKQEKQEFLKDRSNKIKELNNKIKNKLFKKKE